MNLIQITSEVAIDTSEVMMLKEALAPNANNELVKTTTIYTKNLSPVVVYISLVEVVALLKEEIKFKE